MGISFKIDLKFRAKSKMILLFNNISSKEIQKPKKNPKIENIEKRKVDVEKSVCRINLFY